MQEHSEKRSSGFPAGTLAAVILLLAGAVLAAAFVPIVDCPRCGPPWNFFGPFEDWDVHKLGEPCKTCGGRTKLPVLKR